MIPTQTRPERAFLIGVLLPETGEAANREQMAELAELSRTAGAEVVGSNVQRRTEIDPALFIGKGKVAELRETRARLGYDLVICNEDLSPRQQRNLEKELTVKVVDRTELILDIFAQHARTREGRLQIESAQLHHLLPRLIGAWDYHRQGGGIGTRGGPGEQQIEVERRRIHRRLKDLERELEQVRAAREQQRLARRQSELATVAIVGYTNAGKSTLLNALTGAAVLAEHRLFATLDPTTRRRRLPSGREILLTDTVGFIQKLPTDLVAAFRATLEEVTHADVVLEVLDASASALWDHAATVDQVLLELGAGDKPRVVALNKVDQIGPATLRRIRGELQRYRVVPISALAASGLDALDQALEQAESDQRVEMSLLIPFGREALLAELKQIGGVKALEYCHEGTRVQGWAPLHAAHRFQPFRDQA